MTLSEFLVELRKAVNAASNALLERNMEFFNRHFEEKRNAETGEIIRVPKTVRMDYPIVLEDGKVEMKRIDVPTIAITPANSSKLGKASFEIDFQLEEHKGEVEVYFPKEKRFGKPSNLCHMKITIEPDKAPDGIETIIDNYNQLIQKQIEG